MTVKGSHLIRPMDDNIDLLGSAKVFSTLDAYSRYWQVSVKDEDRDKKAFVCHAGTYHY